MSAALLTLFSSIFFPSKVLLNQKYLPQFACSRISQLNIVLDHPSVIKARTRWWFSDYYQRTDKWFEEYPRFKVPLYEIPFFFSSLCHWSQGFLIVDRQIRPKFFQCVLSTRHPNTRRFQNSLPFLDFLLITLISGLSSSCCLYARMLLLDLAGILLSIVVFCEVPCSLINWRMGSGLWY